MNFQGQHRKEVQPADPVDGASADAARTGGEPGKKRGKGLRSRYAWIGTAASIVLVAVSLGVLWKLVQSVTWSEVKGALAAATAEQLGLALLFVGISYLFLTGYDALALRQLKIKVPYRITALASFTSYAVSFTLGFPLLTAGTIRYWIYARQGLSASKIAALTVIAGFTFWLGMGVVLGLSLIIEAGQLAGLAFTSIELNKGVGFAALALVLGYLVWVSAKRRSVTVKHWRLELPGASVSIGQMLVGIGDVCAAAATLYVLLPQETNLGFTTFLAIYVLGAMLGIASNAPGGIGVFEATVLLALSHLPRDEVLTSLLLFRGCYYVVPFVTALAMLGLYEIVKRAGGAQDASREAGPPEGTAGPSGKSWPDEPGPR
ncbi:lysylphosphatidylglycerol synthase domain-containing protein [Methylobacterium sp. NEAU 140]|uniref:lysylphosphatidylglycerol synthase domain-containing protein n=1 Tax=Methylobacterium sp. NEAU 140 TaxID=3064945 RepID=UPI002732A939|nr:lysylphosphatidylglycerol synthase domain-containing protein [Methylobacterium sp. NEAU 140]MDP4021547.1 lysylphosphatidylglycerol synthase domain-containing protein [Methylobacterium sp. NEAU 140]